MRAGFFSTTLLAVLVSLGHASPVWAWGDTAHRIICEIAFQELNDEARSEVTKLIVKDEQFYRFPESCTWMDHPRQRNSEHFVDVPRDFGSFENDDCPLASECLLTAILGDLEVLKNSNSDREKLEALKSLGHWVGDIHQPLHVSFKDDHRGNKINERGPCQYSLHSVWDTCIVEREIGPDARAAGRELLNEVTDEERTAWQSAPVFEWANESLDLARQPSVRYCIRVENRCIYEASNPTYEFGEQEKVVTVYEDYIEEHTPIIELRIKQAGVRLGYLINQALGNDR